MTLFIKIIHQNSMQTYTNVTDANV